MSSVMSPAILSALASLAKTQNPQGTTPLKVSKKEETNNVNGINGPSGRGVNFAATPLNTETNTYVATASNGTLPGTEIKARGPDLNQLPGVKPIEPDKIIDAGDALPPRVTPPLVEVKENPVKSMVPAGDPIFEKYRLQVDDLTKTLEIPLDLILFRAIDLLHAFIHRSENSNS